MRKLKIDQGLFLAAFERDLDYDERISLNAYLDLETGDIEWVYDEDHDAEMDGLIAVDNRTLRESIEAAPNRFLLIPGLSHGEHHEILHEFLASDWTEDQDMKEAARSAYYGSIGGWKNTTNNEDVIRTYYRFRDTKMVELAEEFLVENGVVVEWK